MPSIFQGIDAIEFGRRFKNNDHCYEYLSMLKWANGFTCKKCGATRFVKGRTRYHRRCANCRYDESVTAHTVFHDMKLPVLKAFYILFRLAAKKKGMSTVELGCEVSVQQKTAWLLKRKIQVAMGSSAFGYPITHDQFTWNSDLAQISEYINQGSCRLSDKKLKSKPGSKQLDKVIHSSNSVNIWDPVVKGSRSHDRSVIHPRRMAKIPGSKHRLGSALNESTNSKMKHSTPVAWNIGIQRVFYHWLKGIHHRWSDGHKFAYVDEFHFKQARRLRRKTNLVELLALLMATGPHPYKLLERICACSA